jgi:hypothetical protein
LFVVWAGCLAGAAAQAQEPQLRVDVRLVLLNASVIDANGRPVGGIPREHFRVFESGVEQPISVFLAGEAPVHVALLMDTSGSTRDDLNSLKRAAAKFLQRFGRQDHFALYNVDTQVTRVVGFTANHRAIRRAIGRLRAASDSREGAPAGEVLVHGADGASTILHDALSAIEEEFPPAAERRLILAFTDTLDDGSALRIADLNQRLRRGSTTLYAVTPGRDGLRELARQAVVGFRPASFRWDVHFHEKQGNAWIVYVDESDADEPAIQRRRTAAELLFDRLPETTRVWLLRARNNRVSVLGMRGYSPASKKKPEPLTLSQARDALDEPESGGVPVDRHTEESSSLLLAVTGQREVFITDRSGSVFRGMNVRGVISPSAAWLAEKVIVPDRYARQAELEAAIDAFLKGRDEYLKLQAEVLEQQILEVRGDFIRVVENTGGFAVEFERAAELEASYDRIAQQIKSSYTLGYYTQSRRGTHPLRVEVPQPGLRVRSRQVLELEPRPQP